jgi:hypothetical protein
MLRRQRAFLFVARNQDLAAGVDGQQQSGFILIGQENAIRNPELLVIRGVVDHASGRGSSTMPVR